MPPGAVQVRALPATQPSPSINRTLLKARNRSITDDLLQKWGVACLVRPLLRRTPR